MSRVRVQSIMDTIYLSDCALRDMILHKALVRTKCFTQNTYDMDTEPPKPHLRTTLSGKTFHKITAQDAVDATSRQTGEISGLYSRTPKATFRDVKPDYEFVPSVTTTHKRISVHVGDLTIKEINAALAALKVAGANPVYHVATATISYREE